MEDRVRELEMALLMSHSRISGDIHPLLVETHQEAIELTPASNESEETLLTDLEPLNDEVISDEEAATDALSHAFGTLSITQEQGHKVSADLQS